MYALFFLLLHFTHTIPDMQYDWLIFAILLVADAISDKSIIDKILENNP